MKVKLLLWLFLCTAMTGFSQNSGKIIGTVKDKNTLEPLVGATIQLESKQSYFQIADENGKFTLSAPVGAYTLKISFLGYETLTQYNVNLSSGNDLILNFELSEALNTLQDVVIKNDRSKSARATDMVTPISTQRLTTEEIRSNPGGNFDVSRVVQSLPGVAGGFTANRNDIIVRGGAPNENVYYLDGIEIPVLNHFQTQGASGGATGILNVSFIEDVQLSSSAFDARYDNALASTFVIKQRNGNPEKLGGNVRLSGTEFATTLEGPLSEKTTFIASARRSYLQYLFQLIDLPIRPNYWDFQYKVNHQIDKKTTLNLIGLGAIDNFRLAVPKNSSPENEYILRANPVINQWNYTMGASLKRLVNNGFYTVALSRNMFSNGADRYENNATASGEKLYSLNSFEAENKLRIDVNKFKNGWKWSYGAMAQYVKYDVNVANKLDSDAGSSMLTSNNTIDFMKYGASGQVSKYFIENKLLISTGLRTDMNTFTESGGNLFKTLSPRISAAYSLSPEWELSASVGKYYKLPSYTILGYVDRNGNPANKNADYTGSLHYTAGLQYLPKDDLRFTLEGFYKKYSNYPISVQTGISLANQGADFAAIGNEPVQTIGAGKVYGVELFAQQKLVNKLFYVFSTTLFKSEFADINGKYSPSTWDYGFIASTALGYKAKNGWEFGLKYRMAGGQPYTPFDLEASRRNYILTGRGTLDYDKLNTDKLPMFSQVDLRVDKRINYKKTSLNLFVDIQNLLMYKTPGLPNYTFKRNEDNTGFATTDGLPLNMGNTNAIPLILENRSATVVPSIGFIVEF